MTLEMDHDIGKVSATRRHIALRDEVGLAVWLRIVLLALFVVGAWVASGSLSGKLIYVVTLVAIWSVLAGGLNLTVGYAGQLNLANGAFFIIGAYTAAIGVSRGGWSAPLIIVVATALSVGLSWILGLFVFRARGLHFALLTTGISIVMYSVLTSASFTGRGAGISTAGPISQGGVAAHLELGPISLSTPAHYFLAALYLLAIVVFAMTFVTRSNLAFSWRAVREDEVLAASIGVDVLRAKRSAFMGNAFVATLGGILFAFWATYLTPDSFTMAESSMEPLIMVIIGGPGTILGPIVGAALVVGLPEFVTGLKEYGILLYGAILLLTIRFLPGGLVGGGKSLIQLAVRLVRGNRTTGADDANV